MIFNADLTVRLAREEEIADLDAETVRKIYELQETIRSFRAQQN